MYKFVMFAVLFVVTTSLFAQDDIKQRALEPYSPPKAADPAQWSDAKLENFMEEITEEVFKRQMVDDPYRLVYGMVYEFWVDGKKMQVFGLDSMHDGCWLGNAMLTAHRYDPDGGYLPRVQRYLIPFYHNVMARSHIVFPNKISRQDRKPIEEPLCGWVPRGWDDGEGWMMDREKQFKSGDFPHADSSTIEKKNGEFRHAYGTPSNHLSQDLADFMLNAWITTHDPDVKEAMKCLYNYKSEYWGYIRVLDFAWRFMNDQARPGEGMTPENFDPTSTMLYNGMYLQKDNYLSASYSDVWGWKYQEALSDAVLGTDLSPHFAWQAALQAYDAVNAMEIFLDDVEYRYGLVFFDIQLPHPQFEAGKGKLNEYMSTTERIYGGRGIQYMWIAAGVMPVVREHPEIWEQRYHKEFSQDTLVRIVDEAPKLDAKRDKVYGAKPVTSETDMKLWMVSDPKSLHVYIESSRPSVELTFKHVADEVNNPQAGAITVYRDGTVTAENQAGEELIYASEVKSETYWEAELRIPYTVVPGQGQWINGVDHGRYEFTVNGNMPKMLYMLSSSERVIKRLDEIVLGTVDTWHDIHEKIDMIPSGYRSHNLTVDYWEVGDSGNYAHLIKNIALILMDRNGMTEWEIAHKQIPAEPMTNCGLPVPVLKEFGIIE